MACCLVCRPCLSYRFIASTPNSSLMQATVAKVYARIAEHRKLETPASHALLSPRCLAAPSGCLFFQTSGLFQCHTLSLSAPFLSVSNKKRMAAHSLEQYDVLFVTGPDAFTEALFDCQREQPHSAECIDGAASVSECYPTQD